MTLKRECVVSLTPHQERDKGRMAPVGRKVSVDDSEMIQYLY